MEVRPDVVVYDTLIQVHGMDENDNIAMKAVMRYLRQATVRELTDEKGRKKLEPLAHIIIHHTRKENGSHGAPLSPDSMRGAGAVHAVADLVMIARKLKRKYATLEVSISSRNSSIDDFYLERRENSLTHVTLEPPSKIALSVPELKKETRRRAILACLKGTEDSSGGRTLSVQELNSKYLDLAKAHNAQHPLNQIPEKGYKGWAGDIALLRKSGEVSELLRAARSPSKTGGMKTPQQGEGV